MGTPPEALRFEGLTPAVNGLATINLTAKNPGNPRVFIDGQIYFLTYSIEGGVSGLVQSPDDLISVLVFDRNAVVCRPTWDSDIAKILGQYGRLYPIMSRFGLDNYESVKTNAKQIREALDRPITDPSPIHYTCR